MPRAERCESEFLAAEGKLKRLQLCSAAAPVPRSISVRAFGKVAVTANRQIVSVETLLTLKRLQNFVRA